MRAIGVIRKIDLAGRLVLPPDLCDALNLERGKDSVEILVDDNQIILRKYAPACAFCGSFDGLIEYSGTKLCKNCIEKISNLK